MNKAIDLWVEELNALLQRAELLKLTIYPYSDCCGCTRNIGIHVEDTDQNTLKIRLDKE